MKQVHEAVNSYTHIATVSIDITTYVLDYAMQIQRFNCYAAF